MRKETRGWCASKTLVPDIKVISDVRPGPRGVQYRQSIMGKERIRVVERVDYLTKLILLVGPRELITENDGLQKEACLLGITCTTLRTESEWPETLAGEMNVLSPQREDLQDLVTRAVSGPASQPYGDGHAAERIVELLLTSA